MKKYSIKLKYLMMAKEKKVCNMQVNNREKFTKKLCKEYPNIKCNVANKIFEACKDGKFHLVDYMRLF